MIIIYIPGFHAGSLLITSTPLGYACWRAVCTPILRTVYWPSAGLVMSKILYMEHALLIQTTLYDSSAKFFNIYRMPIYGTTTGVIYTVRNIKRVHHASTQYILHSKYEAL